jgi:hypothetical protein
VDLGYLLFTLLCPLSMVALLGWWAWSMRPGRDRSRHPAPVRSAAEEAELARLRAHLDHSQGSQTQVSSR